MIKNSKEANIIVERLNTLKQQRQSVNDSIDLVDIEKQYTLNSYNALIDSFEKELEEYHQLKNGNLAVLEAKSLEELPSLLIKARIARNLSQSELARRLEMKPQQIQRYEAMDYQNISFHRILEIANELGVSCEIEKTIIHATEPVFQIPDNSTAEVIREAEDKIKDSYLLAM